MNSLLLAFLSLSVSGSLLALLLLLLRRGLGGRVSARWRYYAWLLVVLRLLVPWGPQGNLMERVFSRTPPAVGEQAIDPADSPPGTDWIADPATGDPALPADNTAAPPDAGTAPAQADAAGLPAALRELTGALWVFWLVGAFALLVKKLSGYRAFLGYIKAGSRPVADGALLGRYHALCAAMKLRRPPRLWRNDLAAAPMLVGVFRPVIVLPAPDGDPAVAEGVLRHELTHFRRGDIFYKWLAQLAACLHWFNPLVYRVLAAINRDCELSCDEAVIRSMDREQKFLYGETLLNTIRPDPGYSNAIVSITLNEDTKQLKERLDAIMRYRSKSPLAVLGSLLLAALLAVGALWTGVYAAPANQNQPARTTGDAATVADRMIAEARQGVADTLQAFYAREGTALRDGTGMVNNWAGEWPNYIHASYRSVNANPVSCSFHVAQDTEALLTVRVDSGRLGVTIRDDAGNLVLADTGMGSGQHLLKLPASGKMYWLEITGESFGGVVLLESVNVADHAPVNNNANDAIPENYTAPAGLAALPIPAYLDQFEVDWTKYDIFSSWPRYFSLNGYMSSSGSATWTDLQIDAPTSLVITAHTTGGDFGLRITGPDGGDVFYERQIVTARYRVNLDRAGDYRIYWIYHNYYGRALIENEAHTDVFAGLDLGEGLFEESGALPTLPELPAASTLGKSTDADYAAYHVMTYAGAWNVVEYLLPFMTQSGIDDVVALYNQKNPNNRRTASEYYNLPTPGQADADTRCMSLCENTGNWVYISPLFPYMSHTGIDRVIALYNQKTGNRLVAADYYS